MKEGTEREGEGLREGKREGLGSAVREGKEGGSEKFHVLVNNH